MFWVGVVPCLWQNEHCDGIHLNTNIIREERLVNGLSLLIIETFRPSFKAKAVSGWVGCVGMDASRSTQSNYHLCFKIGLILNQSRL